MLKVCSGVYLCRCVVNGKVYVGSSNNCYFRSGRHVFALRAGNHYNKYLQNAWNKHGAEKFVWEIIEEVGDEDDLLIREQFWIEELHSSEEEYGYNIAFPVRQLAPSARMSKIHKELWENLTVEQRAERIALSIMALKGAHEQWQDPKRRAELKAKVLNNVSKAHARWYDDPEYQARKRLWLQAASDKAKEKWDTDTEFREKHSIRLAQQAQGASDAAKAKFDNDSEYREQLLERCRRQSREIASRAMKLTAFGKSQTIAEWAIELGISIQTIRWRLKKGWTHEQALDTTKFVRY